MKNLFNVLEKVNQENKERTIKAIEKQDHTLNNYLTKLRQQQLKNGEITREEALKFATKKIEKVYKKQLEEDINKINDIMESEENFDEIYLQIQSKKNAYGYQYKCNLSADEGTNIIGTFTNGCGYDKLSSAISEVLNEYKPLLKMLYELKEANINTNNRELIGYGSGYGLLPYFERGVGISCYYKIFNSIGLQFKEINHDLYIITRK